MKRSMDPKWRAESKAFLVNIPQMKKALQLDHTVDDTKLWRAWTGKPMNEDFIDALETLYLEWRAQKLVNGDDLDSDLSPIGVFE